MGADSKIEWTDHTFNPWWGCTKVSPGCDHCYAETLAKRWGFDVWGPGKPRRFFEQKHWDAPHRWHQAAAKAGVRKRVFCASMADVFDNEVPNEWRRELWKLMFLTPHLDWLVLTKRIGNAPKMIPAWGLSSNVWLGISVVNQEEADRDIPKLLSVEARVRFLSCEPLLGPLNLTHFKYENGDGAPCSYGLAGMVDRDGMAWSERLLHWVIVGGESGGGARHMVPDWARDLRDQCRDYAVPFFMKQMTKQAPIPDDLMVRQFPPLTNSHQNR